MGRAWRPLSAGSRASQLDGTVESQVSLCGGMELAAGSVQQRSEPKRFGPMFSPCFATMLYPVTYPQLVGPAGQSRRRRRPHSAGPAMTRTGTIGSGSQTRPVRELKPDTSATRRDKSPAVEDPESSCAGSTFRLSVREREPRASDDERGTTRHRFRSIERNSSGDGAFATSTAGYTARIRPLDTPSGRTSGHNRTRTHAGETSLNESSTHRLPRSHSRSAGTRRRNYTRYLSGTGFQGNLRGQSLLLDAMARRTCHEAGLLMEQNMGAVEDALCSRSPVDPSAWSSLQECRTMYRELLATDEGGMSSVVTALRRVDSLCSLLRDKGLVPYPGLASPSDDMGSLVEPVDEHALTGA